MKLTIVQYYIFMLMFTALEVTLVVLLAVFVHTGFGFIGLFINPKTYFSKNHIR